MPKPGSGRIAFHGISLFCACAALLIAWMAQPARAQDADAAVRRTRAAQQIREAVAGRLAEENQAGAQQPAAAFNVSDDLEHLLEKATQISTERPDLAPVLWQRILDEGANTFARAPTNNAVPWRREYGRYQPFSNVTIRAMTAAGPEALRQYRLHSDGPARALMASRGAAREAALGEVVRRYLLTSVGDDAAFELGCRLLERGDFTSAEQLFERLALVPDSNVPADDILIRRAVANSCMGRTDTARHMVDRLGPASSALQPLLLAEFAKQKADIAPTAAPPLSQQSLAAEQLKPDWEYRPPWTLKGVKPSSSTQAIMSGVIDGRPMIFVRQAGGNYVQTTLQEKDIPDLSLAQLASTWKSAAWRPASQPVVVGDRIYLKSELRTVCCDATTGRVVWMGRPTRFPMDEWTRQMAQVAAHGVNVQFPASTVMNGTAPKTMTEIMLFGDRLHHGLTISNGRVFAIEGELDTALSRKQATEKNQGRQMFGGAMPRAPERHNELACYDAANGRLLWTIGRGTILEEGVSLWSAPLVLGDTLIVATGADNQLGVAALRVSDGSLLWKSMLSDLARVAPTTPVGLAADDGSIYVAGSGGVLFSIDRNGGALRWAVSYPRVKLNNTTAERRNLIEGGVAHRQQIVLEDNFVAREEGAILLAASDSDHVMAFNVTDGSLLWDSPLPQAVLAGNTGYVVGASNGRLILSNSRWLWGINTRGGRIVWDLPLETSYGRGLFTADGLLIPQQRTLALVDPGTGKVLKTTSIDTPDAEPVGNLVAAGDQFLVAGAARMFSVKPAQPAADAGARVTEEPRP